MAEAPIDFGILAGAGAAAKEFKAAPHFALNVMRTLARRLRTQNAAIWRSTPARLLAAAEQKRRPGVRRTLLQRMRSAEVSLPS